MNSQNNKLGTTQQLKNSQKILELNSPIKITYRDSYEQPRINAQEGYISETTLKDLDEKTYKNIERQEGNHTFSNGDNYFGTWENGTVEGYGVYTFKSSNLQYRGQFKNGKQHGRGSLVAKPENEQTSERLFYDGEWMYGQKSGFGKYIYSRDSWYEGDWFKNKKEGQGSFKSIDGEFKGEWRNDQRNGQGKLTLTNGNILNGKWFNDQFIEGVITYSNGDLYEGEVKNLLRNGYGTYTFANNKTIYKGYWTDNIKNGTGEIKYSNGDSYKGSLKNDLREGRNEFYRWNTGEEINAVFERNMPVNGMMKMPKERQFQFDLHK